MFNNNGEICRKFNRGKCNFGASCKYEHRCSYCNIFGHPSLSCRKVIADRSERNMDGVVTASGNSAKFVEDEKQ